MLGFFVTQGLIGIYCTGLILVPGLVGAIVYGVRLLGEPTAIAEYNAVFVVSLVALGAAAYFATLFAISRTFRTTVSRNLPFELPFVRG